VFNGESGNKDDNCSSAIGDNGLSSVLGDFIHLSIKKQINKNLNIKKKKILLFFLIVIL
jgi:hypothetical protein